MQEGRVAERWQLLYLEWSLEFKFCHDRWLELFTVVLTTRSHLLNSHQAMQLWFLYFSSFFQLFVFVLICGRHIVDCWVTSDCVSSVESILFHMLFRLLTCSKACRNWKPLETLLTCSEPKKNLSHLIRICNSDNFKEIKFKKKRIVGSHFHPTHRRANNYH